jgi:uracil-DNA glycosylase
MARRKTGKAAVQSLFPEGEPVGARVPDDFPASWVETLASEFRQPYFHTLQEYVAGEREKHEVLPPERDVFNAFRYTPFDAVKVVILGQDPYPTPGHAHGLCFSVRPGVRPLPASLRNIFKELDSDLGIPPSKHGYLAHWAEQGVLLLNAVLTVRAGEPNSHANKGWEKFTDAAFHAVGTRDKPAVFVLWGAYAQKKLPLIDRDKQVVLTSAHPSPLSAKNGFFGSKPFSKSNAALEDFGVKPIDWKLPQA